MPKPPPGDGNGDLPPRPRPRPTPRPQPTPPPQPIGPAPAVGRYYITLETMHISKTRSPRHDTVTVMFSLQVGSQTYQPFVQPMGDLSDGDYRINMRFGPVNVASGDPVAFAYVVVNSNYDASDSAILKDVSDLLSSIGADILSVWLPGLSQLGDYAVRKLHGIFYANCDGVVAADKITGPTPNPVFFPPGVGVGPLPGQPIYPITGQDLWSWTAGGVYRETRRYPGLRSNVGCGEDSLYFITWSISRS